MPTELPAPSSFGRSRLRASVPALLALLLALFALACGRSDAAQGGSTEEEDPKTGTSVEAPAQQALLAARTAHSRPAGVPDDFVPTPSGYMHPSCITRVAADEIAGEDLVIRKKDGRSQRTVSPCAYPRYSPLGRAIEPAHATPSASGGTTILYDGWLAAYESRGALPFDTSIRGKWVVPPAPPQAITDTTIYFFNDLVMDYETDAGFGSEILQPVLGYGALVGQGWTLTSWNCCNLGAGFVSDAVNVAPGDVIEGTTVPDDCDGGAVCQNWTITATDLSSGESTTLATTEPHPPTLAHPGVLETYSVTACDMLPPTGLETFYDNAVTEGDAGVVPVTYAFTNYLTTDTIACGYSGVSSGDAFTLVFGPSTPTTTALVSSAASVAEGAPLVFTATVAGSAPDAGAPAMPPTGRVTFTSGGTSIGTALLVAASADDAGVATSATASLTVATVGVYAVIATYAGDGEYLGSSSASVAGAVASTLAVSPSTSSVTPSAPLALASTGGVGAVTWSLQSNASGGHVDALGNYTAGTQGGVVDVVVAMDSLHGSATATINVGAGIAITPTTPTVAPGGAMKFTASGGSGAGYAWKIFTNESSGTMGADGTYVAGATGGVSDVVEVTDSLGNFATTTVAVAVATGVVDGGAGGSSSGGVVSPPIVDAGSGGSIEDAGHDGGAPSSAGAPSGGCGCRMAGSTGGGGSSSLGSLGALGGLAMIAGLRRRRNR